MVDRHRRRPTRRLVAYGILLVSVVAYVAAFSYRINARKYDLFFADYVRWALTPAPASPRPIHLFFVFVDHFEPDYDAARVEAWSRRYRQLAARHHDSDGRPPQHTFFYPGEQAQPEIYGSLRELAQGGFGEVELHYHHDFDTAETFQVKLKSAISDFQKYGFLKTTDGQTRFAFIHGNWGLDNADGPWLCGVNEELRLLKRLGCFADFTFPSVYDDAQPPFVNSIYAAKDDDGPKSYRFALPLSRLHTDADLMIFQGPLVFAPSLSVRHLFFDLDDGNIHPSVPASPRRVDRWVSANVHVPQRPDWVFIKVFAHGISTPEDADVVLGPTFDATLSYLERRYNDGTHYRLHYITAREAYNLAMAAADGATGAPDSYRDRPIARYLANATMPTVAVARQSSPAVDLPPPSDADPNVCVR